MVNFIVCGTPGTGKSTIIDSVKNKIENKESVEFINVSEFAIENDCIEEHDDELDSDIIDETKLLEKLTTHLESKGDVTDRIYIIESIHGDILPNSMVDHVFVCTLRNHSHLYDRLMLRNYNKKKLSNNIECEIFREIQDQSREEFGQDKMTLLFNDTEIDIEPNSNQIIQKMKAYRPTKSTQLQIGVKS